MQKLYLYENIAWLCAYRGISLRHLERKAGLSRNTIQKWKVHMPSVDKVKRVAEALEVKIEDLI